MLSSDNSLLNFDDAMKSLAEASSDLTMYENFDFEQSSGIGFDYAISNNQNDSLSNLSKHLVYYSLLHRNRFLEFKIFLMHVAGSKIEKNSSLALEMHEAKLIGKFVNSYSKEILGYALKQISIGLINLLLLSDKSNIELVKKFVNDNKAKILGFAIYESNERFLELLETCEVDIAAIKHVKCNGKSRDVFDLYFDGKPDEAKQRQGSTAINIFGIYKKDPKHTKYIFDKMLANISKVKPEFFHQVLEQCVIEHNKLPGDKTTDYEYIINNIKNEYKVDAIKVLMEYKKSTLSKNDYLNLLASCIDSALSIDDTKASLATIGLYKEEIQNMIATSSDPKVVTTLREVQDELNFVLARVQLIDKQSQSQLKPKSAVEQLRKVKSHEPIRVSGDKILGDRRIGL